MRGRNVPPSFPPVIPLNAHTLLDAHVEAAELARQGMGGVWVVQALHDDGCRACETQNDADCRAPCVPNFVLMSLPAHASFMQFDQMLRKAGSN